MAYKFHGLDGWHKCHLFTSWPASKMCICKEWQSDSNCSVSPRLFLILCTQSAALWTKGCKCNRSNIRICCCVFGNDLKLEVVQCVQNWRVLLKIVHRISPRGDLDVVDGWIDVLSVCIFSHFGWSWNLQMRDKFKEKPVQGVGSLGVDSASLRNFSERMSTILQKDIPKTGVLMMMNLPKSPRDVQRVWHLMTVKAIVHDLNHFHTSVSSCTL